MRTWSELLQFDKIHLIQPDAWPTRWLVNGTAPGDLLLSEGELGTVGGLLKITREGTFITVTADEVFRESVIVWPGANPDFYGIRLRGTKVELVLSK